MSRFNKPLPGTPFNYAHPLCPVSPLTSTSNGGLILPLNEGSGRPCAYLGSKVGAPTSSLTERLAVVTGAKWNPRPGANFPTSQWGGPAISFLAITDQLNLGTANDFIPLDTATAVIGYRKRDTTLRLAEVFGVHSNTASQLFNLDMTVAGAVRVWWAQAPSLTVSSLTFGDDVWVASAGSRGVQLWQNGSLKGTAAYPGSRTGSTNDFTVGDGGGFWDTGSDLADIAFLYIYPRELTPSEIQQISSDPFCFYDWGEDVPKSTVTLQSLTATLSLSGGLLVNSGVSSLGGALVSAGGVVYVPAIVRGGVLGSAGGLATGLPRTRLYFSSALAASAAPAFDAGWNYTTEASRWRLKHTKGTSAMTSGTQIGAWSGTAGQKALDRQYVSNPLDGAQNVGGSIKGQLLVQEVNNTDNVDQIICVIKVVSIDGGTVRGTILAIASRGPTGEFRSTGFRNKFIVDGDAGTLIAAQNGDRIVIEIGYSNSGAGTTPEAFARWGENAADLAENETDTTDGAGWIEFGGTLVFQNDAAGGLETGGALSPVGTLVKQAQLPRGGTLTTAGADTNKLTSRRSFAGTLTTHGAALIIQVFLTTAAGTLTLAGSVLGSFARAVLATGILTPSGLLTKLADKVTSFAGSLTTTGGIFRTMVIKAPDAELVTSGELTPLKLFNAVADGTLATIGTLYLQAGKVARGTLTLAGTLRRTFGKAFSGVLSFFGILGASQSAGTVAVCPLTVADLIARVYERLDADDGTYYTLAEVSHALDMSQRLFAWLTLCLEHRASFVLQAGQAFPSVRSQLADFWAPLRVSLQSTGARLLPATLDDLDKFDDDWQSTSGTPRYYCMMGFDFMAVYPQPAAPVSLHVTYAAEPQQITQFGGVLEIPSDAAPLLVDGAIWILRLKEGGPELQSTLENLDRFVKGAQRYRQYIESRSKAQLYDSIPTELSLFDLSRFKFVKPRENKK